MDHRRLEGLHVHLLLIRHQRYTQDGQGKGKDVHHPIHSLRHSVLPSLASNSVHQHFHRRLCPAQSSDNWNHHHPVRGDDYHELPLHLQVQRVLPSFSQIKPPPTHRQERLIH